MESLWINSTKDIKNCYSSLDKDICVDVCIIGGGITGISTAYMLAKAGLKVCVLEKDVIGYHTTRKYYSEKLHLNIGLFYDYLINSFSENFAKGYLDANEKAISNIKEIIDAENIACDFEFQDNYVFTSTEDDVDKFKHEVLAVNSLGFNAEFVTDFSLPLKPLAGIKFPHQAQFNSLKYVYGLCDCITNNNGMIYEYSKVYDVKKSDEQYITYTDNFHVTSNYVVLASHYPIINVPGFYFLKMYQEASYIIGVETNSPLFDGMYITNDSPSYSFRTANYNGKRILLVGGSSHKVGDNLDLSNCYTDLENVAKSLYADSKVIFRWNTEDCVSLDKIPYIGEFSNVMPNFYVATGFKKWGMTTSNVAGNIICDMILGKKNPYSDIFISTRFKPVKNGTEFVNMLKQVSSSLVLDKFKFPSDALNNIGRDEGKIISIDGSKIGVYKDCSGKLYCVRPICSHLGCELTWNNLDKTWDCPCHGSRFSFTGKSLYSPSIKDLDVINPV